MTISSLTSIPHNILILCFLLTSLYLTAEWHVDTASGDVTRHETGNDDNFTQCGNFFRNVLSAAEKERLTDNIAGNLSGTYAALTPDSIAQYNDQLHSSNDGTVVDNVC